MSLPQDFSLLGQEVYVPAFKIQTESGSLDAPFLKAITSVSVDLLTNQPCSFTLQVNDPKFALIDAAQGVFAEGRYLEIFMGYSKATQSMIQGEITAIGVHLDEGGGLTLQIEGFDKLHAGTRGTGYREFRDGQTDSDIVREIATDMQLTASVDPTEQRQGRRIQNNVSNLEYITHLAEINHFSFWIESNSLMFKKDHKGKKVRVTRSGNLISFSTRLSTSGQTSAIEVRGWDAAQKKAISARAVTAQTQTNAIKLSRTGQTQIKGLGSTRSERIIYADGEIRSVAEAQAKADAELAKQRRALLSIQGSVIGNPDIRAGSIVVLEKMGRFDGEYSVETAHHDISQSGYHTSFSAKHI